MKLLTANNQTVFNTLVANGCDSPRICAAEFKMFGSVKFVDERGNEVIVKPG